MGPERYARTVTLIDGREVSSASEEWRHECEARTVLRMGGRDVRRAYLDKVGARRGKPAMFALEDTLVKLWKIERAKLILESGQDAVQPSES